MLCFDALWQTSLRKYHGTMDGKTKAMWLSSHLVFDSRAILWWQKIVLLPEGLAMDTRHFKVRKLVIVSRTNAAKIDEIG